MGDEVLPAEEHYIISSNRPRVVHYLAVSIHQTHKATSIHIDTDVSLYILNNGRNI